MLPEFFRVLLIKSSSSFAHPKYFPMFKPIAPSLCCCFVNGLSCAGEVCWDITIPSDLPNSSAAFPSNTIIQSLAEHAHHVILTKTGIPPISRKPIQAVHCYLYQSRFGWKTLPEKSPKISITYEVQSLD